MVGIDHFAVANKLRRWGAVYFLRVLHPRPMAIWLALFGAGPWPRGIRDHAPQSYHVLERSPCQCCLVTVNLGHKDAAKRKRWRPIRSGRLPACLSRGTTETIML